MARTLSIMNPFQELTDFFTRTEKWVPPMDLSVKDGNWIIQVELPGVDPKDVHVSVVGDQLTIRGERKVPEGFTEEDFLLQESPYGPFERTIVLPHAVPEGEVEATYSNGVLIIKLPAVSAQAKEIEIKTEAPTKTEEQKKIEESKKEESQVESRKEESKEIKEDMSKAA